MFIRILIALFICASVVRGDEYIKIEKISFSDGLKKLIKNNANLQRDKASLFSFESLKKQADGARYPTLSFLTFVAPIFESRGDALSVSRDYSKWGPFLYVESLVTLPVFTFGRISNARKAADLGLQAGKLLHAQTINETIFEFKKIYLAKILLKRYHSILLEGKERMAEALQKAEEGYREGNGSVKKKDIAQLKIFSIELEKLWEEWYEKNKTASLALGHSMGEKTFYEPEDNDFPEVSEESPALAELIKKAFSEKPDLKALTKGLKARRFFLQSEKAADYPVFFLAARVDASYTSLRDRQDSLYAFDPYNTVNGGLAFGAKWTLDWSKRSARLSRAEGELKVLQKRKAEARTGIPLKVSMAFWQMSKYLNLWKLSMKKYKEASKWSFSEWTSYSTGVGEAKDLLQSLAMFYDAQRQMAESEYNYVLSIAKLALEIGNHSMLKKWEKRDD